MTFKHWTLDRDAEGIAWAILDEADASANTLGLAVMEELAGILDQLSQRPPSGLVIRSGKAAGFIAGANIEEFTRIDSAQAARALVQRGWTLFERLATVDYPTLALIRGHCMGGGLELALACRYRITVDEPGTRLALPEVMLGIYPAWGGMLRLPQLIGPAAALDLMLTGKGVDAGKARRLGLADDCVPPRVMDNAARIMLLSGRAPRRLPLLQRLLNGPLRGIVAGKARKQVALKARPEHYPAPYAILDVWANYAGNALAVPASSTSSLESILRSLTAKNLIRVFFLQERLKGFGKDADFRPRRVHVIGAGVMGGDIATECALRGMIVTLQDQSVERIAPAFARAAKRFERKFRGKPREARFALDRLIPDPAGHGVAQADVIIEAIFENLDAKRALFAEIERRAKPDALLASNTSSLRIADIASALADPGRLVGIHFFNPVAVMPLVEVVRNSGTADEAAKRAAAFVRRLDKLPLPVGDEPGFLVNAVLGPYMYEALRCMDEGVAPETIDAALTGFGMPMGPIELVDTVGLDIAVAAGRALAGAEAVLPRALADRVAAGQLGKKTGQGFYAWPGGKVRKPTDGAVPAGLAERIVAPLLAASQACVDRGVVADADLADAGVIFGTGFAPFTGGPLNFVRGQQAAG
ncbi:3-hydroxyacyl-CoA dehydrogenase NAD-binding domain-containing protein [Zoogloea sp.]|uniref:3-hydroxyacyl-CoA dehydrogenase NAD-binding domain-containing protein n=2 Tax=Zoogloea sp. TaxID=49181 RepID=UPI001E0C4246|nr:3-hydroxyacyl-CoA dehydrogenase NAD-binding domain-containing protein [Zoogloea sp.]MBK6652710.1 enoyl-CoA hydratase/isomerase family protein [Zoogloea sp.]